VKENNINAKRIKVEKYQSEEQAEMIRFIKIVVILVILAIGVYLFTRFFVTKDVVKSEDKITTVPGTVNYSTTIIGGMLNKPEKEYYVLLYDYNDVNSIFYSGLSSAYSNTEKALKIYSVDLNNEMNKKHISNNQNLTPDDIADFKIKNATLLKIVDKKIAQVFDNDEKIAKELNNK